MGAGDRGRHFGFSGRLGQASLIDAHQRLDAERRELSDRPGDQRLPAVQQVLHSQAPKGGIRQQKG
jgi:hypothetical protein